jgi:hypothetical protein
MKKPDISKNVGFLGYAADRELRIIQRCNTGKNFAFQQF